MARASNEFVLELILPKWTDAYIYSVALFAKITGFLPDCEKMAEFIVKHSKVKVS